MTRTNWQLWAGRMLLVPFVFLISQTACRGPEGGGHRPEREQPLVFAANGPLQYFAERIGGPRVTVWNPVPPTEDPAFWRPDDKTLTRIQSCDLILLNDPGYSRWVATSSLPARRMIDTSHLFRDRLIEIKDTVTHRHGPGGMHSHSGLAVGTWLDPDQALQQAQVIREALTKLMPDRRGELDERWQSLVADMAEWRRAMEQLRARSKGTPLLASHPVYEYLARWGNWPTSSVHWEPGDEPGQEDWAQLDKLHAASHASVMLWEDAPLEPVEAALRERGITVVVYRPLAQLIPGKDWLDEMRANAARLAAALNVELRSDTGAASSSP